MIGFNMDRKQKRIWNDILDKFNLNNNAKFMQFRNLKEFRYFNIERINPNHKIELYGKLKNGNPKNIHVGRILIPYMSIIVLLYSISPIQLINIIFLISSLMLVATVILYNSINIMRLFYDCINRRNNWSYKSRFWKNSIYD